MAHILQEGKKVTEIYVSEGSVKGSNYLFMVYDNGTISLDWCLDKTVQHEKIPALVKIGRSTKIEYGDPNLFGTRPILGFQDENGQLEKRWKKIM